jgi:TolA-binding protein
MLSAEHHELRARGDKAFEEKRWISAIAHYRDSAEFAKKNQLNDIEPEDRYNMALAYLKNGDYGEARSVLIDLQKPYPDYKSNDIKGLLDLSLAR